MKTSLRKSKRKKGSMKTTHTLEQVEALMWKESNILRDPNVGKDAKQKARKKLKLLERHFADCNGKELNGKKYPVKEVPVDTPKEEVLKLIEDGYPEKKWKGRTVNLTDAEYYSYKGLDVTGVSVGKNTFECIDKGWSKPKEMKPDPFFK